jgi:hypothetical protein
MVVEGVLRCLIEIRMRVPIDDAVALIDAEVGTHEGFSVSNDAQWVAPTFSFSDF